MQIKTQQCTRGRWLGTSQINIGVDRIVKNIRICETFELRKLARNLESYKLMLVF